MTRILNSRLAYDGYAKVHVLMLAEDDGPPHMREVIDYGQSACVLPYDPDRRVALIVRLPRAPLLRAGVAGHLIEAPAGMIGMGESPETTVRREAMEETGVELGALEPVAACWPSPGVLAERTHLFLAAYRAGDRKGPGGGLADENESITVQETLLADLWRACEQGALSDLKTLTLVFALKARHPDLF